MQRPNELEARDEVHTPYQMVIHETRGPTSELVKHNGLAWSEVAAIILSGAI